MAGATAAVGSSVVKVPLAVCIRSVQAGLHPNPIAAAQSLVRSAGVRSLFTVWTTANVCSTSVKCLISRVFTCSIMSLYFLWFMSATLLYEESSGHERVLWCAGVSAHPVGGCPRHGSEICGVRDAATPSSEGLWRQTGPHKLPSSISGKTAHRWEESA